MNFVYLSNNIIILVSQPKYIFMPIFFEFLVNFFKKNLLKYYIHIVKRSLRINTCKLFHSKYR